MSFFNWDHTLLVSTSFFAAVTSRIRKLTDFTSNMQENNNINEVLFYGAEDEDHRKQMGLNNLYCIYYMLIQTRSSIDMCVPSLMSDTISECLLIMRKKNNIRIRLALHSDYNSDNLCDLVESGVEVRIINSKVKLEHEFILCDATDERTDAVAIIGSLDYEVDRVNCNRDNTLLTSEMAVVLTLQQEFNRVWCSVDSVEVNKTMFVTDDE